MNYSTLKYSYLIGLNAPHDLKRPIKMFNPFIRRVNTLL